jgi:large subunit ribosomal protein L6
MSRIGAKSIEVPSSVTVEVKDGVVHVKNSKGSLQYKLQPQVTVEAKDGKVFVKRSVDTAEAKAYHGLARSLIANMIKGAAPGHEKKLEIVGVGYKVQPKGKVLVLSLGFSHTVDFPLPEGIEAVQDEKNKNMLTIKGMDKQLVGQVAANLRSLRPPEPYKGKGIRYADEHVRRKPGKAAVTKAAAA